MTEIAEALQEKTDLWAKKSAEYRANLKRHFYDADSHTYCGGIQGADAFAVDVGLGDERMIRAIAEKYDALGAFDTGIFGTDILIRILFANGYGDLAMKLLTSEKENSFGAWLRRGETSLCEYWCGRASHNHHMFGAPLRYIFSHAFGVDDSGEMLEICPAELSFEVSMETEMETELGKVFVCREITKSEEIFTLRSDVTTIFRYRSMNLTLKPNVETVLYF